MCNKLALSVFVSQFEDSKERLSSLYTKGDTIFTSLHIEEEYNSEYKDRCVNMCKYIRDIGYTIIADVSKRTLDYFNETDFVLLAQKLDIAILRLDFGFTIEEIIHIAKNIPVCINASTLDDKTIEELQKQSCTVYAMHNYYPRKETALDSDFFDSMNEKLLAKGIEVFSFIPGDDALRGPLNEGLPTLEKHRAISPFAAFVDMHYAHTVSKIFVGDGLLSNREYEFIQYFQQTGIITLPVTMLCSNIDLHNKRFTVRPDSPHRLIRLQESREYATKGEKITPFNTIERCIGSITIDNERYLRYSGEIQIIRENLEKDEKVNVIAKIASEYHLLLRYCRHIRFFSYN